MAFLLFPDFEINILPHPFVNNYLLLIGRLLPVIFSYLLVTRFWSKYIAANRFNQLRQVLIHRTEQLHNAVTRTLSLARQVGQGIPRAGAERRVEDLVIEVTSEIDRNIALVNQDFESIIDIVRNQGGEFSNLKITTLVFDTFLSSFSPALRELRQIKSFTISSSSAIELLETMNTSTTSLARELTDLD